MGIWPIPPLFDGDGKGFGVLRVFHFQHNIAGREVKQSQVPRFGFSADKGPELELLFGRKLGHILHDHVHIGGSRIPIDFGSCVHSSTTHHAYDRHIRISHHFVVKSQLAGQRVNLHLEAGSASPKELISDISQGFYVTDLIGSGVNNVTGDYSRGASGFWIENGEITYPVSEVTLAGHLFDIFRSLTPANDLEFRYGINAPTLRIEGLTLGGR